MVYQLKISLLNSKPEIWRRVLVPENLNFYGLHRVIQIAMGWGDSHLFQFHYGEFGFSDSITLKEYIDEEIKYEAAMAGAKIMDARRKKIKSYFTSNELIFYTYDYGDFWEHTVVKEEVVDLPLNEIGCIDGSGACPPDDCGGIHGYYEMLKSLKNPKDPENESWRVWLGLSKNDNYEDSFGFKRELVNVFMKDI